MRLVQKHKLEKEAVERFAEKLMLQEKYKKSQVSSKSHQKDSLWMHLFNKFWRVDPDVLKACENSHTLYSAWACEKNSQCGWTT